MSFNNLSIELQQIILTNHSYFAKWFTFIVLILLSCYYIFIIWPEQKPTKYLTRVMLRIITLGISISYLFSAPMLLILMSPEYSFLDYYVLPLSIYSVIVALIYLFFFIDLFRYGPIVMLKLGGIDLNDSNANEIANQIINNKHSYKLGKRFKKAQKRFK